MIPMISIPARVNGMITYGSGSGYVQAGIYTLSRAFMGDKRHPSLEDIENDNSLLGDHPEIDDTFGTWEGIE